MKASDINDQDILAAVDHAATVKGSWATTWDVEAILDDFPEKVVLAKLKKLVKRGLINGCGRPGCNCRGEHELTDTGLDRLETPKFGSTKSSEEGRDG